MCLSKKNLSLRIKMISITSIFLITFMAGCSNPVNKVSTSTKNIPDKSVENKATYASLNPAQITNKPSTTTSNSPNVKDSSTKGDPINTTLLNIMQLAKQGKVINCSFPAKTTVMEDVQKKWGRPNKTEWIPSAKGMYSTYLKQNITFGYNKGSQIFEVRSFDAKIKKLSLSKIKKVFGTPAYDVKVKNEEIIGYVVNKEFKILLVFPKPTSKNIEPLLDHYSVLFPQGTVNLMADDPGREW